MTVLLVRHGLTDANATGVIQGHQPTPLNAEGLEQARRLATRLAQQRHEIGKLISSDLPRAMQTAEAISAACDLPIEASTAWRERCMGELEGRSRSETEIWRAASAMDHPAGAESELSFRQRVSGALIEAAQLSNGKAVVVVTHGGPVYLILRMLCEGQLCLASGAERPKLVPIANCSILSLDATMGGEGVSWKIGRVNDTDHLESATLRDAG